MKRMGEISTATIIITNTVAVSALISPSIGLNILGIASIKPGKNLLRSLSTVSISPSEPTAVFTIMLETAITLSNAHTAEAPTVKNLITDLEKPRITPK